MQLSKINNINFSRKPILTCSIKDTDLVSKRRATIYELEPNNWRDEKEAYYLPFHKEFLKEMKSKSGGHASAGQNKRFYVLKDPYTHETFSWAQTSHCHKATDPDFIGNCTIVEEFGYNDEYTNVFEPMLAAIANQAKTNLDSSISLAIRKEEIPDAKNVYFSENHLQEQYIDKYRFDEIIEQAHDSSDVAFFDYKI